MGVIDTILAPIKWAVAWVMVLIHDGAVAISPLGDGPGTAWVISIVGLTIVVRILIIPLFFRQIRASRAMQLVQPELKKLQDKYKNKKDPASRQRFQEEMQALYKDAGTSPFASCLPLLLQMPIFFGLFQVLNALDNIATGEASPIGPLTQQLAADAENSLLFGAPISSTFMQTFGDGAAQFDSVTSVRIVTVLLIIAMSLSTFFTQRQLTMKNMPPAALESPMFRQQQILLYILPVVFAVTGVNFPIGVLIYWFISNLWSMGQQFYTIKRQPTPGSEAYKKMVAKKNEKRARKGLPPLEEETPTLKRSATAGQRKPQPKRGSEVAAAETEDADEASSEDDDEEFEVRGKDGLTAAERAQKRYERRQAERRLAAEKRKRRERGNSTGKN
ncbi:MAG: membrane protein insertase YidC [Actinomycetaceae bacterium]